MAWFLYLYISKAWKTEELDVYYMAEAIRKESLSQHTWASEKAMAPHSSTLAWKIPWMEEPGGLQSMGSLRVGHDWATSLSLFHFHALEKEIATHSSFLAWRIPGAGEPGGLTSMGSRRVGLNSNSNMSMEFDNYFQKIVSILFNGSTSASDRALIQVDFWGLPDQQYVDC